MPVHRQAVSSAAQVCREVLPVRDGWPVATAKHMGDFTKGLAGDFTHNPEEQSGS